MLPPLDPKVLEQNSSFAIVYKDLCTRKLDSDGCSKESKRGRGGVVGEEVHRVSSLSSHRVRFQGSPKCFISSVLNTYPLFLLRRFNCMTSIAPGLKIDTHLRATSLHSSSDSTESS